MHDRPRQNGGGAVPEQVKLWRIADGDRLEPVQAEPLDVERRLEEWIAIDALVAMPPTDQEPWNYWGSTDPDWSGVSGYFRDAAECDRFLQGIGAA